MRRGGIEVVAGPVEVHRAAGGSRSSRTAAGRPGPAPAASSWRGRRARSSPRGSRPRGSSSRNGTGVSLGYEQIVPIVTTLGTPARRHSSMSCAPIIRFSKKNEPGFSRFAPIPPTRAARCTTMSGPRVGQQAPARLALHQVVVLLAGHHHLGPARAELGVDAPPQESRSSRQDDAFAGQCPRSLHAREALLAVTSAHRQPRKRRSQPHRRLASPTPTPTSRSVKIPPLSHASAMRTRGTNRRSTSSAPGGTSHADERVGDRDDRSRTRAGR